MPKPRSSQVSLVDTPYYHCVTRCVRRSYLCGEDALTGKSYEHRRQWVEDRLLTLASVFAIDVCAFAVMSNHTHVVVHVNQALAQTWSIDQVLERWHQLHKGTLFTRQYVNLDKRKAMTAGQIMAAEETAEVYRQRLYDLSWFMRHLNEYIAREANREEGCTGRFWEGRFKSQALLDEAALAACMAYVDLNPVRAGIEKTPETSKHTSIKLRADSAKHHQRQPEVLMPLAGNCHESKPNELPFLLSDYLSLVDMTGRVVRDDKKGQIDAAAQPILSRLGINGDSWLRLATEFEQQFCHAAGSEQSLHAYKEHIGQQRIRGMGNCRLLLNTG